MEKKILYSVEYEGADALLAEMAKIRKENNELKKENKEFNDIIKDGTELTAEQATAYEKNAAQMKINNTELNKLTKEYQNNGKSTETVRKKLGELRKGLQEMAVAGDKSSDAYIKMRNEAASLQDQIDKVNAEVKIFADDAIVINTVVDATKGLAQGFQLVQSAQALLGFESEKFQEVMQKLVATQTLINSLQGISNTLQKSSRIIIVGKAVAVKAVTIAQNIWNAAMMLGAKAMVVLTGGLILLVPLIIALVQNFEKIVNVGKKVLQFLGIMKKNTDEVTVSTKSYVDTLNDLHAASIRFQEDLEFEIELMRAKGKSIDDIKKKERELIEEQIRNAEKRVQLAFIEAASLEKTAEERAEAQKQFEAATKELDNLWRKLELHDAREKKRQEDAIIRNKKTTKEITTTSKNAVEEEIDHYKRLREGQDAWDEERRKSKMDEIGRFHYEEHQQLIEALEQELITIEQYEELKAALDEEIYLRTKEREDARKEAEREQEENDFIMWLEQRQSRDQEEIDLLMQKHREIEDLRARDIINEEQYQEALRLLALDTAKVQEDAARTRIEAEMAARNAIVNAFQGISNAIQSGADEMSAFAAFTKMVAISNSVMNIAQGLSASASIGFPQNIIAIAGYVGQTAGIISQIKNIRPPKYADGGFVGGKPHAFGGTKYYGEDGNVVEFERDEYLAVINKRDAGRAAAFDEINRTHGRPLGRTGRYFAQGGSIMPRQDFDRFSMQDVVRDVVDEIVSIPVVNDVRSTRDVMRKVENLERSGDL